MANFRSIPSCLRYNFFSGWIGIEGNQFCFGGEDAYANDGQCIETTGQEAEIASSLLHMAKVLLAQIDPEVSKEVLLEAGLREGVLEDSSLEANPLRGGSNDLKVLKVKVNGNGHKTLLKEDTEQRLLESNIPAETVRFFSSLSGYANALNNSRNPGKAAATMMAKPKFDAMFKAWLLKNPVPQPPSTEEVELPTSKAFEIED
jgi:hypothetical protein